ncbi:MAG: hypothetical protein LBJ25_00270 [Candidatus Margulisbacteria bacterium]|jgi:hypothetical protein|nr:hypothetical protein [Candidatus Margulisiibacteriota bacterium]
MRSFKLFNLFNALILFCVMTVFVSADSPQSSLSNRTISFQGYLTNSSGSTEEISAVSMNFLFYENAEGGNPLYTKGEDTRVTIFNGNYTAKINLDTIAKVEALASASALWVEVWVDGVSMNQRIEMIAAPYAMLVKGIKYDAVNDTVMIGYHEKEDVSAISTGGMVVKNYISIGGEVEGSSLMPGTLYIRNGTARFEGNVSINMISANAVYGAIWN